MNKNLRRNIFIIVILGAIFLVLVMNMHKIRFGLSLLSIYNKEQTEVVVNEDQDKNPTNKGEPKEVESPLENPLESIIDAANVENIVTTDEIGLAESEAEEDLIEKPIENPTKSYTEIVTEYNARLSNLQNNFIGDLDNLISQGYSEYKAGNVSTSQLFMKYMNEGSALEKNSDGKFNTLLNDMEKELKDNNHDTSVTDEVSNYYNGLKSSKKSDIIGRGMEYINK